MAVVVAAVGATSIEWTESDASVHRCVAKLKTHQSDSVDGSNRSASGGALADEAEAEAAEETRRVGRWPYPGIKNA